MVTAQHRSQYYVISLRCCILTVFFCTCVFSKPGYCGKAPGNCNCGVPAQISSYIVVDNKLLPEAIHRLFKSLMS